VTTLDIHVDTKAFDADHAVLRQVGWVGHARGVVYSLDTTPAATEPGGYSPLYIQVGTYVFDADGNKRWED
jgi:hypothetical protein